VFFLQEQIDREAIAITVNASKLAAKDLAIVLKKVVEAIKNRYRAAQTPHGKQSVKKLMNHNMPTNTIPIEGDKGLFEQVARKWNVDYAFHKTGPKKYLLLFKSGQADAITAAFSEYSNIVMKQARDKRMPIMDRFKRASERAELDRPKHKERDRKREVMRE